jgi:predicted AlkP superfamily phosphohydrolase/phosphomutase
MSAADRSHPRVVTLALDMGDGDLIQQWARAGHLPNLRKLIDAGTWVELESPAKVLHTSTWPTFATGTLPGTHGVYYPYQPEPGHQQAQHIRPDHYGAPTFWSRADRHGRRCVVYDIPETFPEAGFNGEAIFEWGTWAWYGEQTSQPNSLMEELGREFGKYPLGIEALQLGLGRPNRNTLQERLPRSVAHKRDSLKWFLKRADWDLIVAGFCETHPAGHYLWPASFSREKGTEDPGFDAIRSVYAAIDDAIGKLSSEFPSGTVLIVVSGDGVRPNHAGWHLLPKVLERLGYTNAGAQTDGGGTKSRSLAARLKDALPPQARRWVADHMPRSLRERVGAHLQSAHIDWSRTRAFTLPTDLEGYIRINLKEREPQGIVQPGAEYDALCADIRSSLLALKNPATGRPAVEAVWLCHEVFAGQRQQQLPDLVVSWNDEAPIAALEGPGLERVEEPSPDPRTGTHSTRGFMLAHGSGIARGAVRRGRLEQVAPTILDLLGLRAESGFDGPPIDLRSSQTNDNKLRSPIGG